MNHPDGQLNLEQADSHGIEQVALNPIARSHTGLVGVRGVGRGRTIGVPTANIAPVNETLPGNGVYACWIRVGGPEGPIRPAVANVGRRPTFGGAETTVEAHVLDVDENLYDQPARLAFQVRLRPEQAFSGAEALVAQIQKDIERGRAALGAAGIPDAI
jgi:riboflavin kinase/FMN adenylyltransferase